MTIVRRHVALACLLAAVTGCQADAPTRGSVPGVTPSATPRPSAPLDPQQQLVSAVRAGDILVRAGSGKGSLTVTLRKPAALYFACLGRGSFRIRTTVGGSFSGPCPDSEPHGFVSSLTADRYPARIVLTIDADPAVVWRVSLDSEMLTFP